MTTFTYANQMVAHLGGGFAIVPDQVADNQKDHDQARTIFTAYPCDMAGRRLDKRSVRVRLDGDAYGLHTPGTGDMRVRYARHV